MAYQGLNTTSGGIQSLLDFPNLDNPFVWPLILFAIYAVIAMGTFFREVSRIGSGNMLSSLAVAGFVTSLLAGVLSLIGVIGTTTLIWTIVASGAITVIYLLTEDK